MPLPQFNPTPVCVPMLVGTPEAFQHVAAATVIVVVEGTASTWHIPVLFTRSIVPTNDESVDQDPDVAVMVVAVVLTVAVIPLLCNTWASPMFQSALFRPYRPSPLLKIDDHCVTVPEPASLP